MALTTDQDARTLALAKARSPARALGAATVPAALLLAVSCFASARGETLADAIAEAYRSNPTLAGQRAQQQVVDETYASALTALRPTASATLQGSYEREDFGSGGGATTSPSGALILSQGAGHFEGNAGQGQITITQALYTGGRLEAGVQAAELTVMANREALRLAEVSVMQQVIQAYADVRRDQEIVQIRRADVEVLASQLDETQAKFQAGQVTRTDTAQAEAQLASVRALLSSAQAQLEISRAEFAAVVGHAPGDLAPAPALPGIPGDVDEAFAAAESSNPSVRQAILVEQASRAKVAQARAANMPTISLQGSVGYLGAVEPFVIKDFDRTITAMATVTQPIFTGGLNASNIRSALAQNNADRLAIEAARRQAVQSVAQAWSMRLADKANLVSDQDQVTAASVAFDGVQAEYRAGLRTTLDVLLAEQTLRSAQLSLVGARHDYYVADAALLAAAGRLEARVLVTGVPLYDPSKSLLAAKRVGAVPWEGLVEKIDALGSPGSQTPAGFADASAPRPRSATDAAPAMAPPSAADAAASAASRP